MSISYTHLKVLDKRTLPFFNTKKLFLLGCSEDVNPSLLWFILMPIARAVSHGLNGMFSPGVLVRPQQNVLVLGWWCKTVINVCFLFFGHILCTLSLFPAFPIKYPLFSTLLLSSVFFSLFLFCLFTLIHHLLILYFFTLFFLFVLQASELGMTSAFYKYILTTMVRTCWFFHLLSFVSCFIIFPCSSFHPFCSSSSSVWAQASRGAKAEKEFNKGR